MPFLSIVGQSDIPNEGAEKSWSPSGIKLDELQCELRQECHETIFSRPSFFSSRYT